MLSQIPRLSKYFSAARTFPLKSTFNGQLVKNIKLIDPQEGLDMVKKAHMAQLKFFNETTLLDRIEICRKSLEWFSQNSQQVAQDITMCMGKPIVQSQNEVKGLIFRAKTMIVMAPEALGEKVIKQSSTRFLSIQREPVGTVLILAPFNYPLLCVGNHLYSAVLAGNSILLKHSKSTPLCGEHFEQAFKYAGAPDYLVQNFQIPAQDIYNVYLKEENLDIDLVTLTGSVASGKQLNSVVSSIDYQSMANISTVHTVLDCILELGGKDGMYVTDEILNNDIELAVDSLQDGAYYNTGQGCCSVERVYVHTKYYKQFVEGAIAKAKGYVIGDPMDPKTTLGTLDKAKVLEIEEKLKEAQSKGAKVLAGGKGVFLQNGACFLEPAVVVDIPENCKLFSEETFGPVMQVYEVKNDEEAIQKINKCDFGLTNGIYTSNKQRALEIASRLESGTVYMNRCDNVDPTLPWIGVKESGKGFSLSKYGFDKFTHTKSINFTFMKE